MSSQWLNALSIAFAVSRIPSAHILHGRIGENDAPAEGVVRLVALDDRNVMGRVFLLHQQAEIEPSRAASDANDAHMFLRPESAEFYPPQMV